MTLLAGALGCWALRAIGATAAMLYPSSGKKITLALAAWGLFVSCPSVALAQAITATKTCVLENSGAGCVFDLTATTAGTLAVDSKAGTAGRRWRVTIHRVNTPGGSSNVGNGSTTEFTGRATLTTVAGAAYLVVVTHERPTGSFPTSVQVRFTGPFRLAAVSPRPQVEGQTCAQINEGTLTAAAVDVETIVRGALVTCQLSPAGDTDAFTFTAPAGAAVSINTTAGFRWSLTGPSGLVVGSCAGLCSARNLAAGTYTIEVFSATNGTGSYTLSMQGVSQPFTSGVPMAYGDLRTGRVNRVGDTDAFRFTATLGDQASINLAGLLNRRWSLFDPLGRLVVGVCTGRCQTLPLMTAGVYTIVVHATGTSTGDYSISLQNVR